MRVDLFDFDLPPDRIAQRPVSPRDAALLLHVHVHGLADCGVRDLPGLLKRGDLLVFNDTKVIPARLTGLRGEAKVSVTLHQMLSPDGWRVFAKPGKRLRVGDRVVFAPCFSATVLDKAPAGDIVLRFDREGADLFAALHEHGAMPLPPYIRGGVADDRDDADYQTLFAKEEGAVLVDRPVRRWGDLVERLRGRRSSDRIARYPRAATGCSASPEIGRRANLPSDQPLQQSHVRV